MTQRKRIDMTRTESAWTSVFVLGLGILVGWLVFTPPANQPPPAPQQYWNWGSIPDWVAAFGALVAAGSTIAIALIADGALKKREIQAERLGYAVVKSVVIADMEMAVRMSRLWANKQKSLTTEALCKVAMELTSKEVLWDPAQFAGLPPGIVSSLLRARGKLTLLQRECRNAKSNGYPQHASERIVSFFESFATVLRPAADAVAQRDKVVPWHGWKRMVDADKLRQELIERHHMPPAAVKPDSPAGRRRRRRGSPSA